jgi:hypothetical protein
MRRAVVLRRLLGAVVAVSSAGSFLLVTASPCLACSCAFATPAESFAKAGAAFIGQVERDAMTSGGTTQTFRVDEVFKGELLGETEVWAQIGTEVVNTCSVLYPVGDRVAVLLFEDAEGRWTSQACAQITEIELRKVGGTPREPTSVASPSGGVTGSITVEPSDPSSGPSALWVIGLGAGAAAVMIALQIVWVGRRDRRMREAEAGVAGSTDDAGGGPGVD